VPVSKAGYFPILDLLRLIASLCVVLAHSTVFFRCAAGTIEISPFVLRAGYYGVIFFYTLSGFLITYLLLKEKKAIGTIAPGAFYKRRALRIWPLYYLIVLLSFFVFPYLLPMPDAGPMDRWKSALLLYLLFLPNVAAFRIYLPTCFHTYTIGYEEQFYLVWPFLLRRVGKRLMVLLGVLFFLPPVLEAAHLLILSHGLPFPAKVTGGIRAVLTFINYSNVPAFIAGAVGAVLYIERKKMLISVMGNRWLTGLLLVGILYLMYAGRPGSWGYVNLLSIVYALLILNLIGWDPALSRAGKVMVAGGRISYGIYIYHPAVLIFVSFLMARAPAMPAAVAYLLYLFLSLVMIFLVSAISYYYFERFFLRKKERFRPVMSRE
jgi:peptidoglycan/LPS O-acetylase OafA/YrhL